MQEKFSSESKKGQDPKEAIILLLFCLFLIIAAIRPLTKPGFFSTMDGHLHVNWAIQLKKSLTDGHFPVRWAEGLSYGYGSPIFNFYAPLFHYLASLFSFPTGSLLSAIKLVLVLSFIFSALFMFLFAYEFWGPWGATISSLAYVYAPYQFVDVYVRGAFPEFLTFPLFPLIFWLFYKFWQTKKQVFFFFSSLSSALLIFVHSFLGMASLSFLLAFLFLLHLSPFAQTSQDRQKGSFNLFLSFGLGVLLGSFFWLPLFFEKKYLLAETLGLYWNFRDSFLYPQQLIYSPWGYGGSVKGPDDGMSFQIGFPHVFLVFFSLFVIGRLRKDQARILIFSLLAFLGAIFMTLPISILIWELVPFFSYAYFPWRFLAPAVFFASLSCGSTVFLFSKKTHQQIFALVAILLIVGLNASFARPKEFNPKDKEANYKDPIFGVPRDIVVGGDFTPRWVQKRPNSPPPSRIVPKINEKEAILKTHYYEFKTNVSSETQYTINTFYFPGWQAFVDNKETKIKIPDQGIMQITVPQGSHQIKLIFGESLIRKLADLFSLTSLIILLISLRPTFLPKTEAFLGNLTSRIRQSEMWKKATALE